MLFSLAHRFEGAFEKGSISGSLDVSAARWKPTSAFPANSAITPEPAFRLWINSACIRCSVNSPTVSITEDGRDHPISKPYGSRRRPDYTPVYAHPHPLARHIRGKRRELPDFG